MADNPSRRVILGAAPAVGVAFATIGGVLAATAEADLIFAMIELHKAACDAHYAASEAGEDTIGPLEAEDQALANLVNTKATSILGLTALATHLSGLSLYSDFVIEPSEELSPKRAIDTIAASLRDIVFSRAAA
jgi:hypothetical protein